ncbi:class I SAM-dependent methyltransferase [Pseudalkalibacillus caeni]|uniref:Class I SAM-dependent methyltransferase n=1 Tax=Exobacillus caeni TaxID=2574798 RepID=A0A5R9F1X7_9BACL|nr:class I SAM-dependent methyltransferase [Pseudalkalibacillus caeni]TLS37051.1 class I SAM-dependent methyltransferase [Pseudalkalibacillus caeni]
MLSKQGFDLWANEYDKTVQVSEENNVYPFAGYKKILNTIFNEVMQNEESQVLDIGFGTGVLTGKLYENNHTIHGIDFSAKMIEIAKSKMPQALLLEWDISKGVPEEIKENKYDAIISTYALHHLPDDEKVTFIKELQTILSEEGKIFIGDIAFQSRNKLEKCRRDNIDYWDEEEFYFVFDELKQALRNVGCCEFHPISHCGGVIVISK